MDVTFTIGGVDFSAKLSTYAVDYEYSYSAVVTALDGTEHFPPAKRRAIVSVSFWPLSDAENAALWQAVSTSAVVIAFTDPYANAMSSASMRFSGKLSASFGLRSIDGNRYYKGGTLQFRQITPR